MPDQATPTTVADEDRLSAAVVRLRQNVIDAHQFRPADETKLPAFNQFLDDMLQTLIETTTAAAVDRSKIIVTKDLSAQRQQFQLEAMAQRSQDDIDNRKVGAAIAASLLKIGAGS